MTIPVHRDTDDRVCGAQTTVQKQTTVFANSLLIAVDGDPNTHGGGNLIAECNNVYVEGKLVVNNTRDNAYPDGYCPGALHCNPMTNEGSPDVFVGDPGGASSAGSSGSGAVEISGGAAPAISISNETQIRIDYDLENEIRSPRPVGYTNNQVSSQYPITPNSVGVDNLGTTSSLVDPGAASSTATADQIPAFLSQVLQEAANNQWDETRPTTGVSNPNIIGIWKELGFPETSYWQDDQTPWCAGFVNWVLKKTGYRFMQSARAFDFSSKTNVYGGVAVPLSQGQPGDIVVWDYSHVNFIYTVPSPGTYTFVGGNQSDNATTNNNPSNGSVTHSWQSGWTTSNGRIRGIYRPVRG